MNLVLRYVNRFLCYNYCPSPDSVCYVYKHTMDGDFLRKRMIHFTVSHFMQKVTNSTLFAAVLSANADFAAKVTHDIKSHVSMNWKDCKLSTYEIHNEHRRADMLKKV